MAVLSKTPDSKRGYAMKNNKSIIGLTAALIILLQAGSGAAWSFPWQAQEHKPTQDARFNTLYNQTVSPLNTIQNINQLTPYMEQAGYTTIKVYVIDYNKVFYLQKGAGTTLTPPTARIDRTFSLTSGQVRRAAKTLSDGKISYPEKWELFFMLRWA